MTNSFLHTKSTASNVKNTVATCTNSSIEAENAQVNSLFSFTFLFTYLYTSYTRLKELETERERVKIED